jgi:hypothetical protein
MRPIGSSLLIFALATVEAMAAQPKVSVKEPVLECPNVMAHTVDRKQHSGWSIYSNMPVRLTGADIQYVVDEHLEAALEPDQIKYLNDENLSTAKVFQFMRHLGLEGLSLVCHYGVHAQLTKAIPASVRKCTIVHHGRFDETREGEFKVFCQ